MNPLQGSGVSERSRCGAVRILAVADEPSTGIGRVGALSLWCRAAVRILAVADEPSTRIGRVRERADTPDPCRGFIGPRQDGHGTTPIPAEGSPASDPTRPIPVEGSSATARMRTAPQRERADTPDPCRGFIGPRQDGHGTTPIPAEGSPASDPTRPIPVEGSSVHGRMGTAPHRSPQRVRRRAIRHARSL